MKENSKKHFYIPFFVLATVLLLSTLFFLAFGIISQKKEDVPFDIVVANVTTSSAEIYWKTKKSLPQVLSYKEKSSTAPYKTKDHITPLSDNLTSSNVYIQKIENLHPNETYIFKIKSGNTIIEKNLTFKTLQISDELVLPTIEVGEGPKGTLVLVSTNSGKYMLDTQYHGTWAFDSKGEKYSTSNYANYTPEEILQSSLNSFMQTKSIYGVQKAYAEEEERSGPEAPANCKVGIKIAKAQSIPPNQWKVEDIIGRWTYVPNSSIEGNGCAGGNYSQLCYTDIYCRSLEAGVNPGVVFAVWANESGGSNYARFLAKQRMGAYGRNAQLADFGIEYDMEVPHFNLSKQLDWFLEHNTGIAYIGDCAKDSGYSNLDIWGIKFRDGTKHCKTKEALEARLNSSAGSYGKHIGNIYRWFTGGELVFPFTIEKKTGVCDRSNEKVNQTVMTCTSSHLPTAGYEPNPAPLNPTVIGMTGNNSTNNPPAEISDEQQSNEVQVDSQGRLVVTNKTVFCTGQKECTCIYSDGTEKHVANGWGCTPDGEVTKVEKVCCQISGKGMWITSKEKCQDAINGTIREDIPEEGCYSENITYNFRKGNNFIQLQEIHNSAKIPMQTANDLLKTANGAIISISKYYENGWQETAKIENGKIYGKDFNLEPGGSYFVVTKEDLALNTFGTQMPFSAEGIPTEPGWAMIGNTIFPNGTSTHMVLNNETYKNIQQIAVWDTTKNKFLYSAKGKEVISGEDVALSSKGAAFVKIE